MKVLLIAGHGAGDPGAVATLRTVTYREAEQTRLAAAAICSELVRLGAVCDIYDTSRNAYSDYALGVLGARACFAAYDYVLELHFNAISADAGDGKTKGVEIYWPSSGEPSGKENGLLDAVSAFGLTRRKAAAGKFGVINTAARAGTKANLLEICFLDDADDMKVWAENQADICNSIANEIMEGYGMTEEQVREIVREEIKKALRGDDTTVSNALKGKWTEATEAGITDGTRPGGYATRAQVATMVVRGMKRAKELN